MAITILDALASAQLLGACEPFRNLAPWRAWLAFLRACYGLPLDADGERLFRECTGRSRYDPPPGGWNEVACIVGRQAGKTRAAAALVAFEAAMAPPVRDGQLYALLLAQDHRAAIRTAFSYLTALFESSAALANMVVGRTSDTLELANGIRVAAYPARPAAIRGLRAVVAVADELAFFRSSDLLPQDVEALRALRPTLATTGGKLVILSSPYGQSGALWDLHRRHYGRDEAPVLVWQASAPTMHPDLPADYLARMEQDDPEAFRSEVLGEFRAGLATLLDPEAIAACVVPDRRELPPVEGVTYSAFADPSGGRADAFTLAIGHRDGERAVVDALRAWPAPFNPSGVVHEVADLLRSYRVASVEGDRFAAEWPVEQFRAHGIGYEVAQLTKSDLYLALVAIVNSQRVELPDDPKLLAELRGLERRRGPSGKDRVDHRPGAHDDRANALAGLAHLLVGRAQSCTWQDLYPTAPALEELARLGAAMSRQPRPGPKVGTDEWRERVRQGRQRVIERKQAEATVLPADIRRFRHQGIISKPMAPLAQQAAEELGAWIADLGGERELSAQERSLLEDAARVSVVLRAETARYLASDGNGKVSTEAGAAIRASAMVRRNLLEAVGLKRRARDVTLGDVVAELETRGAPEPVEGATEG